MVKEMMMKRSKRFLPAVALVVILAGGCSTAYYNTMERMGVHKRDLMVSRVGKARDTQEETKEQFKSALEQFKSVVAFDGGKLSENYEKLNDAYEKSRDKALLVKERIDDVEDVAEALFEEWESELEAYSSEKLRRSSSRKLSATKKQYRKLLNAMKKAESKIDPVLSAFRDQVLFLKHNLNAQAIGSLKSELGTVESDVDSLIREMETSIRQADTFISEIEKDQ